MKVVRHYYTHTPHPIRSTATIHLVREDGATMTPKLRPYPGNRAPADYLTAALNYALEHPEDWCEPSHIGNTGAVGNTPDHTN